MGQERRSALIAERLRGSGHRVTKTRIAVYDALLALGGHRGADEVHSWVSGKGLGTSRASVYSALELFSRLGLAMVADAGPGRALYEAGGAWHHHAVCRVCGEVADIECVIGAKPCLEASGTWGTVDEAQVIFRGVCRKCAGDGRRGGTSPTATRNL
jgi:Fur family ferric uptake transcriptional regulator